MASVSSARDLRIDLLRFLGLALVAMAHVGPPAWLFQLRNFDVPLMVLVSGAAFSAAAAKGGRAGSYRAYVWKRCQRLVLPVWIFLTVYFAVIALGHFPPGPLTRPMVAESYALLGGIGYVWIFRVFVLVALLAPMIARLDRRLASHWTYLAAVGVGYLLYELLLFATRSQATGPFSIALSQFIYYALAYGAVFAVGIRLPKLGRGQVLALALCFFAVFCGFWLWLHAQQGGWPQTQQCKYPPSAYYLAYALAMGLFSWLAAPTAVRWLSRAPILEAAVLFIARNTMWVYLWHIPFVENDPFPAGLSFPLKYAAIFGSAALAAFLQVTAVKRLLAPAIGNRAWGKSLAAFLVG